VNVLHSAMCLLAASPLLAQPRPSLGVGLGRDFAVDWGAWQLNLAPAVELPAWRAGDRELSVHIRATGQRRIVELDLTCQSTCPLRAPASYRIGYEAGATFSVRETARFRRSLGVSGGRMVNVTGSSDALRDLVPSPPPDWSLKQAFVALEPSVEWYTGLWRLGGRLQLGKLTKQPEGYLTGLCEVAGPDFISPNAEPCRSHRPSAFWQRAYLSIGWR
jgi:hypothetical protein